MNIYREHVYQGNIQRNVFKLIIFLETLNKRISFYIFDLSLQTDLLITRFCSTFGISQIPVYSVNFLESKVSHNKILSFIFDVRFLTFRIAFYLVVPSILRQPVCMHRGYTKAYIAYRSFDSLPFPLPGRIGRVSSQAGNPVTSLLANPAKRVFYSLVFPFFRLDCNFSWL